MSQTMMAKNRSVSARDGDTPFQALVAAKRLTIPDAQRFQRYVANAGGSVHTDEKTLALVFSIWEEKGRP